MRYRSEYNFVEGEVSDVFDGTHYQDLRKKKITLNGTELDAQYFSDTHNVALGLSTNGFAPWHKPKYTAWPLILFNYNLLPEHRFHLQNVIALSVIPGPKKPKDIISFLYSLVEELFMLSEGVRAFDANTENIFTLRAFLIMAFGDILAVSFLMQMKGHNGISPCRCCNIEGVRAAGEDGSSCKVYYVLLDRLQLPNPRQDENLSYDPRHLPMRTHEEFIANADALLSATTLAA